MTLHLQVSDGAAHLAIEIEYTSSQELESALELAIPTLAVKGIMTVHMNTLNWKCGVAKVEQNHNLERSEHYQKTGN